MSEKICGYYTEGSAPPGCRALAKRKAEKTARLNKRVTELTELLKFTRKFIVSREKIASAGLVMFDKILAKNTS